MLSIKTVPSVRELRAFAAVYRGGSFAAAARQLSLSQPAVTVLLRELESKLGVRLFDRTTRSLHATAAADEAIDYAQRTLGELEAMHRRMQELAAGSQGSVRVAATSTVAQTLLPDAIGRFERAFPAVRVQLDDCGPGEFADKVFSGAVDLGVGSLEQATAGLDERILVRDNLCVIADRGVTFASASSVSWRQLASYPLITVKPGYGIRASIDRAALRAGAVLEVRHEVSLLGTALAMAAAGLGVSVLPTSLMAHARYPNLVARKLVRPTVERNITLVTRQGRSVSGAATAFMALLRRDFGAGS
jgi:DNA-binding transcriptional LysR family regulator